MSTMYITQRILIDDELVESMYSVVLPHPKPIFDYDGTFETFSFDDSYLEMECWNKNVPKFDKYWNKELNIKIISDQYKKLILCKLVELRIDHEDPIFKSELIFHVIGIYEGSKCPYCKKYEMDLENTNKDGIVYNTCKACGQTWYEWDDLNKGLEGKAIFNEKEVKGK